VDIISWKRYDAVVLFQFHCCFASILVVNGHFSMLSMSSLAVNRKKVVLVSGVSEVVCALAQLAIDFLI
jgi:hypothetical protein